VSSVGTSGSPSLARSTAIRWPRRLPVIARRDPARHPPAEPTTGRDRPGRGAGCEPTPVREALLRLGSEGLIIRGRHGWTVREFTMAEIRAIYEVRAALEGYAARLTAQRGEERDFEQLGKLIAEQHRLTARSRIPRASVVDLNDRFHDRLFDDILMSRRLRHRSNESAKASIEARPDQRPNLRNDLVNRRFDLVLPAANSWLRRPTGHHLPEPAISFDVHYWGTGHSYPMACVTTVS